MTQQVQALGQEQGDPVFERASVRNFTDEPVSDEKVEQLLRAAMAAPSAGNQQPWEFYVVRDAATRAELAAASPYGGPAAGAPCVIVVCRRALDALRWPSFADQDMGACCENILLEAVQQKLDAVWLGVGSVPERERAVARALGIGQGEGADLVPFALIALGNSTAKPVARGPKRYDPARVHAIG